MSCARKGIVITLLFSGNHRKTGTLRFDTSSGCECAPRKMTLHKHFPDIFIRAKMLILVKAEPLPTTAMEPNQPPERSAGLDVAKLRSHGS